MVLLREPTNELGFSPGISRVRVKANEFHARRHRRARAPVPVLALRDNQDGARCSRASCSATGKRLPGPASITIALTRAGIPCAGHTNSLAVIKPSATTSAIAAPNTFRLPGERLRRVSAARWGLGPHPGAAVSAGHELTSVTLLGRPSRHGLIWRRCHAEALIALVGPDQHRGVNSHSGEPDHLTYAVDPLHRGLPGRHHYDRIGCPRRQVISTESRVEGSQSEQNVSRARGIHHRLGGLRGAQPKRYRRSADQPVPHHHGQEAPPLAARRCG